MLQRILLPSGGSACPMRFSLLRFNFVRLVRVKGAVEGRRSDLRRNPRGRWLDSCISVPSAALNATHQLL